MSASAAWRMDSGVMSPGLGGIICRRVVRGAGGSTKACAVAAAKNRLRIRMVVRHFWWFLATSRWFLTTSS